MEVIWYTWVVGLVPLIGWLLWWWNDIWYSLIMRMKGGFASGLKLPPGYMGFPVAGEMPRFLSYFKAAGDPDEFINSKRRRYGDGVGLYRTHLFGSPAIIAWTPATYRFITQNESKFILKWPTVEIVGNTSIVAVQGKAHSRLRSFVTRAINQPEALRRVAIMVQPRIIAALQAWSNKGRIIAHKETRKVTFENIGRLFASLEPGPVLDTLDDLFMKILNGVRSLPINIPGTTYHRALQSRRKAIEIFKKELEKKKKKKSNGDEDMNTNDLMDGLMQLKDDEGNQLSETEVLDNIVSLVVAGYESTALTIMWSLYILPKYPNVLKKLREENMSLSKSKNGELITSDDIAKLKYTNKVVEETIRVANLVVAVFRTATQDVEYNGYIIPKGWKVLLWIRYLHTNPENFDDPMTFNPDRWNEPAKPGTYQVFGGGSRICAGNMLARLQVAIFLHYLSVGYKWELVNPNAEMAYLSHPKPVDGVEIDFSKLH